MWRTQPRPQQGRCSLARSPDGPLAHPLARTLPRSLVRPLACPTALLLTLALVLVPPLAQVGPLVSLATAHNDPEFTLKQ